MLLLIFGLLISVLILFFLTANLSINIEEIKRSMSKDREEAGRVSRLIDEIMGAIKLERCDDCNRLFQKDQLKEVNKKVHGVWLFRNKRICSSCLFDHSPKNDEQKSGVKNP